MVNKTIRLIIRMIVNLNCTWVLGLADRPKISHRFNVGGSAANLSQHQVFGYMA